MPHHFYTFATRRSSSTAPSLLLLAALVGGCSSKATTPGDVMGPGTGDDGGGSGGGGSDGGTHPTTGPSEWTWRGGSSLNGNYNNTNETTISVDNAAQLTEAWTFPMITQLNGIAPAFGGNVYANASGTLYALDASGNKLWSTNKARGTSSPAYSDGMLYFEDVTAHVVAVDITDGTVVWSTQIDTNPNAAGYGSVVVIDNIVIGGATSGEEANAKDHATFRGSVVAWDKKTGMELWRHYTVESPFNGATVWSTPAVDPDTRTVFVGTGNNYTEEAGDTSDSLLALKVDTGEVVWNKQLTQGDVFTTVTQKSSDSDFGADPILFEGMVNGTLTKMVAAGQKSGMFSALDRTTGDVIWQDNLGPGSALIGGILNNGAFDGQHILVAANSGTSTGPGSEPKNGESGGIGVSRLVALDPGDGTVVWERQLPAWVWSPISVANGVGFVSYESHMQAFNVATGEKLMEYKANGTIASGFSIADGHVFFGSGLSYYVGTPDKTFHCLTIPSP